VFRGKGQMAIIGKRTGVATIFGINMSGFLAWFLWRNVYLSKIPNLEKRVRVLLDWTIDLFFDRDISRLRTFKTRVEKEYQSLDAVDDVW
jgi:NADH dehydrogenase